MKTQGVFFTRKENARLDFQPRFVSPPPSLPHTTLRGGAQTAGNEAQENAGYPKMSVFFGLTRLVNVVL